MGLKKSKKTNSDGIPYFNFKKKSSMKKTTLMILLAVLCALSSCALKSNPPQNAKPTEGQDRPPMEGKNSNMPINAPPPDYVRPEPPKPLKNVLKDCQDSSKTTTELCPRTYAPVCGCNNITYSNECFAKKAGVLKWTQGTCN